MCISSDSCLGQTIECCIVTLKKFNFNQILIRDKLEIIRIGRPKCELNQDFSNQSLNVNLYEQVMWLTGCSKLNKLFCWACLLFNNCDTNQWTSDGFNGSESQLNDQIQMHESDEKHIFALQQLEEMKIDIHRNDDDDDDFMNSKFDDSLTNFLTYTNSDITQELFENTSGIILNTDFASIYEENIENTSDILSHLQESATEIVPNLHQNFENTPEIISNLHQNIENVPETISNLNENIENASEIVSNLHQNLENASEMVPNLHQKFDNISEMVSNLRESIETASEIVPNFQENISQASEIVPHLLENIENASETESNFQENFENVSQIVSNFQENFENVPEIVSNFVLNIENTPEIILNLQENMIENSPKIISNYVVNLENASELISQLIGNIENASKIVSNLQETPENTSEIISDLEITTPIIENIENNTIPEVPVTDNLIQKLVKHRTENTEFTLDHISTFLLEIQKILQFGKPKPVLNTMKKLFRENPTILYDRVTWLTGCDITKKLFCLPCLFFNPLAIPLNTIGYDLVFLLSQVKYHSNDEQHLAAVKKMEEMYQKILELESASEANLNVIYMDSTEQSEIVELLVDNPENIVQILTTHSPDIDAKIDIVLKGRPGYDSILNPKHEHSYNLTSWLTECSVTKKLYCWPCLLFNSDRSKWNSEGFSNVSVAYQAAFHSECERHKNAVREHYACVRDTGVYNELLDKHGDSEERDWLLCKLGIDYDVITDDVVQREKFAQRMRLHPSPSCHSDSVDQLLQLSSQPPESSDKVHLLHQGRPTPALPGFDLLQLKSTDFTDKSVNLYFYVYRKFYSKYKWLTGCVLRNRLYCWACLFYNTKNQTWACDGFNHFHSEPDILSALEEHGECEEHRAAVERLASVAEVQEVEVQENLVSSSENIAASLEEPTEVPMDISLPTSSPPTLAPQVDLTSSVAPPLYNTTATQDIIDKILMIPLKERPSSSVVKYYAALPKPTPLLVRQQRETDVTLTCNLYVKYDWITGSIVHQKLYCWPCLLCNVSKGNWSCSGYGKMIDNKIASHVNSLSHKLAVIQLVSLQVKS